MYSIDRISLILNNNVNQRDMLSLSYPSFKKEMQSSPHFGENLLMRAPKLSKRGYNMTAYKCSACGSTKEIENKPEDTLFEAPNCCGKKMYVAS